jgi:hypothetical protein
MNSDIDTTARLTPFLTFTRNTERRLRAGAHAFS